MRVCAGSCFLSLIIFSFSELPQSSYADLEKIPNERIEVKMLLLNLSNHCDPDRKAAKKRELFRRISKARKKAQSSSSEKKTMRGGGGSGGNGGDEDNDWWTISSSVAVFSSLVIV